VISLSRYSQHRTLTHLYLFKEKQDAIQLKIYDLSQKCISKQTFSCSELGISLQKFSLTDPPLLIERLCEKKLIVIEDAPNISAGEDYVEDIERLISQIKSTILCDNQKLREICCPLTLQVFEEPVMDNHGDTYEKRALEAHLKTSNLSPINRQPITEYFPNRTVKNMRMHWTPTPKLFNSRRNGPITKICPSFLKKWGKKIKRC
jgi:hypothetical protein